MKKKRGAGILLPISSLPSKYGIGCFSKEAYEFVDQLEKAGFLAPLQPWEQHIEKAELLASASGRTDKLW